MIETVEVTGRQRKPAHLKASVRWWFDNQDDQKETDADAQWYMPGEPAWKRRLYWKYFRNPMVNFRDYVIGVADRNYSVTGKVPAMTRQRDDLGELGHQWCFLHGGELSLPLPYWSYAGKRWVFQFGWQPIGRAVVKINRRVKEWSASKSVAVQPASS